MQITKPSPQPFTIDRLAFVDQMSADRSILCVLTAHSNHSHRLTRALAPKHLRQGNCVLFCLIFFPSRRFVQTHCGDCIPDRERESKPQHHCRSVFLTFACRSPHCHWSCQFPPLLFDTRQHATPPFPQTHHPYLWLCAFVCADFPVPVHPLLRAECSRPRARTTRVVRCSQTHTHTHAGWEIKCPHPTPIDPIERRLPLIDSASPQKGTLSTSDFSSCWHG